MNGPAVIRNCLISGNTNASAKAASAGGLVLGTGAGAAGVTNVTVAANTATDGSVADGACVAAGRLANAIVWGNGDGGGTDLLHTGGNISFSCFPSATSDAGNIALAPGFRNAAAGDYRIGTGSPCLDTGHTDAAARARLLTDLLGFPRLVGRSVDMGCYECQSLSRTLLIVR